MKSQNGSINISLKKEGVMHVFYLLEQEEVVTREVPDPNSTILPGVRWGRPDALFTPCYWMTQYWMNLNSLSAPSHRIGSSFQEEVVACLLGGHGISGEVGNAAFQYLKECGIFESSFNDPETIADFLRTPLTINGRKVVYRFWSQKARYIANALNVLQGFDEATFTPISLRNWLMELNGIGAKTASWIVRNWTGSNEVAILDIHIIRAGILMKMYSTDDHVERKYFEMEGRFLTLSEKMGAAPSHLDALIWAQMRSTPRIVNVCLKNMSRPLQVDHREMPSAEPQSKPYQLLLQ
jgi:thermostable 8-oxoguanine DNA glycosylase